MYEHMPPFRQLPFGKKKHTAVSDAGRFVEGTAALEDVGTGAVATEKGLAIKVGADGFVLRIAVLKALVAVDCAIFVCVDVLWVVLVEGVGNDVALRSLACSQ